MNYHDVYLCSFVLGLILLVFVSFQDSVSFQDQFSEPSYIPPKKFPKISNFEIKNLISRQQNIIFSEILNIQNA